jgi:hypothetical protein
MNRVMGIMSAIVATYVYPQIYSVPPGANVVIRYANTSTPVPIYICAALYIVMAAVAAAFPFEPMGKRSS